MSAALTVGKCAANGLNNRVAGIYVRLYTIRIQEGYTPKEMPHFYGMTSRPELNPAPLYDILNADEMSLWEVEYLANIGNIEMDREK